MSKRRRQVGGIDRLASGRYRVRVADPATAERVSLGTFRTRADAEHALGSALSDQSRGRWRRPDSGVVQFGAYAEQWVASRLGRGGAPLRPRVRELYEGQLRLHLLPTFGTVAIGRLSAAMVRRWYAGLLEDGPGASTAAKCYRLLRAILNTAVEDGLLAANPCMIRGAGAERADERPLPTIEEVFALADAVKPRYRALVLVAAFSGLRRGELFGLRREHVDLERGTVTVALQRQQLARGELVIGPPKSDAGRRTVTLPAEVLRALAAHLDQFAGPDPAGWVFTGDKGGPLREGVWQHEWTRARDELGLGHLHFHDLRHGAATLAAATGAGVKEIMYRIGHSSPQAALRYQHASTSRDRRIAEGISDLIRRERRTTPAGS
ncbi:MAG TPA: tyrosine-type recombinase/integrase [Acidimicrobiales bacterium]|nr:tyrosine-type recombinase/integrase [Acidimicrobiales bacterium]